MTPSELSTPRLLLRPFAAGDLDALAAIYADPAVMRMIRGGVRLFGLRFRATGLR